MSELKSRLSKEDQAVVEWYKKPSVMKPIVVDTDREIENLLAELEVGNTCKHERRRPSVSVERVSLENREVSSPIQKQSFGKSSQDKRF